MDVSNFDTSNVTDMIGMFNDCSRLEMLDLNSFETSKVTDMSLMFSGCSTLEDLKLNYFNTINVINMGAAGNYRRGMFYGCSNLQELDLSSFDTRKVIDMGGMFAECSKLRTVYVGQNWSTSQADTNNMYHGISSSNINFIQK